MDDVISSGIIEHVIPYTDITVSRVIFSLALLVAGLVLVKLLAYFQERDRKQNCLPLPRSFLGIF